MNTQKRCVCTFSLSNCREWNKSSFPESRSRPSLNDKSDVPQIETPWGISFPLKINLSKMFCRDRRIQQRQNFYACIFTSLASPSETCELQETGIPTNQVYALWTLVNFPEWPAGCAPGFWRKAVDRDRAVQGREWKVRLMWIGQRWGVEDKANAICHTCNSWR